MKKAKGPLAVLKTRCGCKKTIPIHKPNPELMVPLKYRLPLSDVCRSWDDTLLVERLFGMRRFRLNKRLDERRFEYEEV